MRSPAALSSGLLPSKDGHIDLRAIQSMETAALFVALDTSVDGLGDETVLSRQLAVGKPKLASPLTEAMWLLLSQFKSPITIILILAALLSFGLSDPVDAAIILLIVTASALLGFWQEYHAAGAIRKLLDLVSNDAAVVRNGIDKSVPIDQVVVGDVVKLRAGDAVPADCRLLEARDLHVDEAALTGETFPVEKQASSGSDDQTNMPHGNLLFLGTHIVSGTGLAVAFAVGAQSQYGNIAQRLKLRPPETDFEHGIRLFGYFLMEVTLILVVAIFAINVYFHRPVVEAFLFSLALAVGLTPQLLPAIISVNLATGARRMARRDVIVRRLSSIENFGSMNVLCSDKTGTLTEGKVQILKTVDAMGKASQSVALYAYLNAAFETGFDNPIDQSIRQSLACDITKFRKLDECPYDFLRKRLSILVGSEDGSLLICKGAVDNILSICSSAEMADLSVVCIDSCIDQIRSQYAEYGDNGFRTLAIAYRRMGTAVLANKAAEANLVLVGFIVLQDPPKQNIGETIASLGRLGVNLKMITGDNRRVANCIAKQVGLETNQIITGSDLREMSEQALINRVQLCQVFAEVEPNQKERIILACQKAGNVVGYLGDGINDATALHAADVGISVDQAVDVAKEAADIVLLKHDLAILVEGVREGRRTFANTMKYVFMATSANFGNMFSMAGASVFLSYLPLLPKQILLMNMLTDLPEMTIAGDTVDDELIEQPQRWNVQFIRKFMIVFGTLSSLFDFAMFAVLLWWLHADEKLFQTGWFIESVISATLVVLVVRTRRPVFRSLPGPWLLTATIVVVLITLVLPFTQFGSLIGFTPVALSGILSIAIIVLAYVCAAEFAKAWFFRSVRQH